MQRLAIYMVLAMVPAVVLGQTALGDSDDDTAILLGSGGTVSVNFSDNSAKLGYLRHTTSKPLRFGFEFSGKASNGLSTLVDDEDIAPEASARLFFGFQPVKHQTAEEALQGPTSWVRDQWIVAAIGYRRNDYKLFDPERSFDEQVFSEKQESPTFGLFYNALLQGNILLGVALEHSESNNFESLKKVQVEELTEVGSSDGTVRAIRGTESARQGLYMETDEFKATLDIFWVPGWFDNRVAIDFFVRYRDTDFGSTFEPGIGFFVVEKGAPSRIMAGITARRSDESNKLDLGLVAGYKF